MTGDTANGISSSVNKNALPRKRKRVTSQANASPNTTFTGTVTAVTSSVKNNA